MLVAGNVALGFSIGTLTALFCLLKRHNKLRTLDIDQTRSQSNVSFHKGRRTRLLTHIELEQATNRLSDDQKLFNMGAGGTIYSGVLADGLGVAVHKVHCTTETDLIHVLSRDKILSEVTHSNMACILGCFIDSGYTHWWLHSIGGYTPLVVYEFPGNSTLEQHLRQKIGLEWHKRLKIAAQISSVHAHLQSEIFPPVLHHGLQSGCVLLDQDMSVKFVGFELLDHGSRCQQERRLWSWCGASGDIAVGKSVEQATVALQKIRNGKVEEVVDPILYYHEQPPYRKEEMG